MPAITSENLVLGLAALLTLVGLVGLAPSLMSLVRRRRLLTRLADLNMDEAAAETLFTPVLAASIPGPDPQPGPEIEVAGRSERTDSMLRTPVAAAVAGFPAPPLHTGPAGAPRAFPEGRESEEDEETDALEETGSPAEVPEETGDEDDEMEAVTEDGEAPDEDDLLAMFRETKITSSAPAVLTEALEHVTAVDLLEQARELRDMLRRA